MKNKKLSFRSWRVVALCLMCLFGIGQMWGAEIFGFTVTSSTTAKDSYSATGGTATLSGSAMSTGGTNELTIGTQTFYKFNSSSQWTFTLSSGKFAAGDVITFTCCCESGSDKSGKGVKINNSIAVTGDFPKNTTNTISYTVVASDGVAGQSSFYIKRNDSNIKFGTVSVTRSSGDTPVCPSGLTISSKNDQTAFTEGDKIELTAALEAGNGTITYQWYKGSVAAGNAISGATAAKYEKSNCTTADAGNYFCVASKDDCSDAVNASAFAITVAADTKCFNMPAITSKPADLASVVVTGGTLSDVSTAKAVAMNANGLKLDGNSVYLKVTLADASIIAGTKITVAWKGAGSGAGIAVVNGDLAEKVIDETNVEAAGSATHTFTAAEAANYADEFIIHRNASGTGIYVNAITVEDCGPAVTKHTITLNYNDGETPAGSLKVVGGNAAVKPADPTRGKYTFLGWFVGDTDNEYVWSSAVNDDITLKAHWQDPWTITFDADGGSAVADITVKHNTAAEKPADPTKDDYDFIGWYNGENAYDWSAAVTSNLSLTAHWNSAVAKYDVEYYDGETKIGTEEQVWANAHPTAAGINTQKPLYTFVGWYTSSTLEGDPVALNTVTPVEGLKLYGKWNKAYATSYDMEAYAASEGASKAGIEAALTAAGYAYTNINGIDNGHTHNYTYDGMKYKTNDGDLSFNVVAGKVVEVKTGHLPSNDAVTMYINGVADATVFEGADEEQETHKINYFYSAAEALYRLDVKASKGTCSVKKVTIRDPYTVSFEAHGDADPSALQGMPSVTLPDAANGTSSLLGWFDAETGGNKIGDAGETYIPTANITLHAQWEAISTDNTLSDLKVGGETVDGFSPSVHTYYVVLPYGTKPENIPAITATANSAKAKQVAIQQAVWTDEPYNCYRAQANVQAEDESWGYYDVRFSFASKDGVSIIKVATTGGTNKTVTGVYAGDGDVSLSSSKKMDNGKYIGFTLDGTTLQAGDRINVHTTQAANTGGSHIIFYDNMTDKNELYETGEIGGEGDNIFTINAAMVGSATAYVYRANNDAAHQWNGYVDYIEVTRAMNPVLTAITIDGRAGVIDEEHKTVAVQIPHEAVLSSLTVVPTIIRNAAHATTPEAVVSNAGAWILGDNTYRVMDKDGDYTDYTITLTRDVLKHTVSFNTHGGSAVASELVVDGESLEAAPAAPEKEDYLFQGWAETDGGAIVDVTTFAISADKEFHAVWAPDGAIKLIEAGAINHTNFITGATMASSQVEVENVNYDYALLGGTASSPSGQNQLNKFITYNATTTQTKVMVNVYNTATSARQVVIKGVVEGSTTITDIATIDLDNGANKHVKSAYYSFDNAANRTIYISVPSSVNSVDFLQVKVIESGEQLPMFGKSGYSINFNEGRFYGPSATNLEFEGMTYNFGSNYNALNSTVAVFKKNTSYQINVPAAVTMTITASAAKYYVSQATDGTDNETAAEGAHDFDLTAGTWYINVAGSNLNVTNIAFTAPKCEKPVFNALDDSELCEGDPYVALDGTGTVTDGGSITYKWYAEGGTDVLGTNKTYTPEADGNYYVVALHHVDGFTDNEATSDVVSVTHFASAAITTAPEDQRVDAGQNATLSVVASGKAPLAYQWYTCDENGDNAEAIDGAESASYVVAVTAGFSQYYKVVVTSGCGSASAIAKVEEWVELPQVSVSATTTWDWQYAASSNVKLTSETTPKKNEECVMANIKVNNVSITNDNTFNSQALIFYGEYARNHESANGDFASIGHIKFNVTVPGRVTVYYANNKNTSDNVPRALKINDAVSEITNGKDDHKVFSAIVPAGEVTLMGVNGDGTGSNQYIRISKIEFKAEADHERDVVIGNMGTVCLPNPSRAFGVKVYELAGKGEGCKVQFDELAENEVLEAGKAYVLVMTDTKAKFFYTSTSNPKTEANDDSAMKGNLSTTAIEFAPYDEAAKNVVFFKDNAMWNAYETGLKVKQYRAYLQYDEVGVTTASPAPGRRRVTLDMHGQNTATGMDELNASETPVKVLINGQIYIIRGEKMYDATGKLVK